MRGADRERGALSTRNDATVDDSRMHHPHTGPAFQRLTLFTSTLAAVLTGSSIAAARLAGRAGGWAAPGPAVRAAAWGGPDGPMSPAAPGAPSRLFLLEGVTEPGAAARGGRVGARGESAMWSTRGAARGGGGRGSRAGARAGRGGRSTGARSPKRRVKRARGERVGTPSSSLRSCGPPSAPPSAGAARPCGPRHEPIRQGHCQPFFLAPAPPHRAALRTPAPVLAPPPPPVQARPTRAARPCPPPSSCPRRPTRTVSHVQASAWGGRGLERSESAALCALNLPPPPLALAAPPPPPAPTPAPPRHLLSSTPVSLSSLTPTQSSTSPDWAPPGPTARPRARP